MDDERQADSINTRSVGVTSTHRHELIEKENVWRVLPFVETRLRRAMEHSTNEYTYEQLCIRLHAGASQLWLGCIPAEEKEWMVQMIAVTSIRDYENCTRLRIELIEGVDFENWREHLDVLENWAVQFGVVATEAYVRPGFTKILAKSGWKKAYDFILHPITRGSN